MSPPNNNGFGRRIVRFLKWAVPLAFISLVILLAILPQAIEVDLGEVSRGSMRLTVDEDGETRIRERYIVSAPLAGRLLRVELDPGDPISEEQILATLDPGEPDLLDPRLRAQAEARVKAAEASLTRARTQLENARVEAAMRTKAFNRIKELFEKGTVEAARYEMTECLHLGAQLNIGTAESAEKVAAFDLEQARAALLHTTADNHEKRSTGQNFVIQSPIPGRVLRVFEESSTVVAAGTRLLEIGDPSDLEIYIDVLSQDAVNIRPGQRVILEHWGGAKPLTARVRLVEPSAFTKVSALGVDEQRVYVVANLEDRPGETETIGDNFRVEARIVIWESDNALRVPAGALFRADGQWAVYRLWEGRAMLTPVDIGRNNGNEAEVLDGLTPGDQIILHPSDQIQDGASVKTRS